MNKAERNEVIDGHHDNKPTIIINHKSVNSDGKKYTYDLCCYQHY